MSNKNFTMKQYNGTAYDTLYPATVIGQVDGLQTALDAKAVKTGSISLTTTWTGSASPYTQVVTVSGATVTANSKVDLQPSASVLSQMLTDDCNALYIENNNGTLTAYAVGNAPTVALTIQCSVTEVTA